MLKVQLVLLAVGLVLVCTATESPSWPLLTNPNMPVRACGSKLSNLLQRVCGGRNNKPLYTKRSIKDVDGDASRQSRGILHECCKKSCSYRTLSTYCTPIE